MSIDGIALAAIERAIAQVLASAPLRPLVVGLCGAQGSGKSTLSAELAARFNRACAQATVLSLDDLYLTKAQREVLARDVHPMLRTRGVPGTHDAALGAALFDALDEGRAFSMPRFDKSLDDRAPRADWDVLRADTRLVIFEGWCVGARAQPEAALMPPVNELERNEDSDGIWRRHVNMVLGGVGYQRLFHRIDVLILLAAPNFSVVRRWRLQQEHELSGRTGGGMSDDEVSRFVMHYERLSRFILAEMPLRADMVIRLGV